MNKSENSENIPTNNGKNGNKLKVGGNNNNKYNAGRKKGSLNFSTIYTKLLDSKAPEALLAEVKKANPKAKTFRDVLALGVFNKAMKGNPKAMELLHYYDSGKPKDTVEHQGNVQMDINKELTKEELKKELDELGLSDKLFDK